MCTVVLPDHVDAGVQVSVSVWKRLPVAGATTWNVAWTVCPVSTAGNDVGDVGVTDQPVGACRPRCTCLAARSPLSVKDAVAVTGCPAVRFSSGLIPRVAFGEACVGLDSALTR